MPEPNALDSNGLTALLNKGMAGDAEANERAFELVYAELRRSAQRQMRRDSSPLTLSPTALVNEVYIKLNDGIGRAVNDRVHFFSLAARAMRQVLLDHQRKKQAVKRGGQDVRIELTADAFASDAENLDYFALDQALDALRAIDARATQVIELHFFTGLNFFEIADLLGVSDKTARRDWDSGRAFLLSQLSAR
jgi:RNA polymerase sigma factor (TIGR02999 family)